MGVLGVRAVSILLLLAYAKSQGADEELAVVTIEMFATLQGEVNDLYGRLGQLQEELKQLAASIQNLATDTAVVGSVELAELQALIETSNIQQADISRLITSNEIWRKNFKIVNITFERLKKVINPIPVISVSPPIASAAVRRILPSIRNRPNMTMLKISTSPKPALFYRPKH